YTFFDGSPSEKITSRFRGVSDLRPSPAEFKNVSGSKNRFRRLFRLPLPLPLLLVSFTFRHRPPGQLFKRIPGNFSAQNCTLLLSGYLPVDAVIATLEFGILKLDKRSRSNCERSAPYRRSCRILTGKFSQRGFQSASRRSLKIHFRRRALRLVRVVR